MTAATEVWLALGYAAFLLAASSGLRWLAGRTARGPRFSWFGRSGPDADVPQAPWPHSDAARFERGLSGVLEVLTVFILAVTAVRHPAATPLLLGAVLTVLLAHRRWLANRIFRN